MGHERQPFHEIREFNTPLKDKVASPVVLGAERYETFTDSSEKRRQRAA